MYVCTVNEGEGEVDGGGGGEGEGEREGEERGREGPHHLPLLLVPLPLSPPLSLHPIVKM